MFGQLNLKNSGSGVEIYSKGCNQTKQTNKPKSVLIDQAKTPPVSFVLPAKTSVVAFCLIKERALKKCVMALKPTEIRAQYFISDIRLEGFFGQIARCPIEAA